MVDAFSAREGGDKGVGADAVQDALADAHPEHPEPYNPERCPECTDGTEPVVRAVRTVEGVQRAGFDRGTLYVEIHGPGLIRVLEIALGYGWTLDGVDPTGPMARLTPEDGGDA